MRCKKGFLAIEYVAGIILLLIGAALLFLVINQFTNVSIDREACKASVVSRASLPVAGKGYVPLNCRTEKICITGKFFGGKCDELKNAEGVKTIKVGNNEAGLNQIQKIYAESITECWNMMGRGRVSLFAQSTVNYYGVGEIYPTCVVCSRIAIDRDSLDNVPFEDMNVREYMMRYAVPGKDMTYFDFMMGEGYMPVDVGDSVSIPDVKEVRIRKVHWDVRKSYFSRFGWTGDDASWQIDSTCPHARGEKCNLFPLLWHRSTRRYRLLSFNCFRRRNPLPCNRRSRRTYYDEPALLSKV